MEHERDSKNQSRSDTFVSEIEITGSYSNISVEMQQAHQWVEVRT
jgi:hypothetical protein